MATNKLQLTFASAASEADFIQFYVSPNGVPVLIKETFVTLRDSSAEATIGTDDNTQAQLYADAINADYSAYVTAAVSNNIVTVSSTIGLEVWGVVIEGDMATSSLIPVPLSVTGLESNRYLINNPIIVQIGSGAATEYYRVTIENTANGITTNDIILYPSLDGVAHIDIAPYIKGIFQKQADANGYILNDQPTTTANPITVSVYLPSDVDTPTYETTKTFISGGNRTNNTNQVLPSNAILRPSIKLPVWAGYDTAEYYIDGAVIRKRLLSSVDPATIDYRRSRGCNRTYVKFLNQKGGYSNWLFESYSETESNTNQGTFILDNKVDDLGNESNNTRKVYGKIPSEYIGLMNDLIISPEIYVLIDNEYVRVTSARNSIVKDSVKTGYYVSINFEHPYRFNPTILWSNL